MQMTRRRIESDSFAASFLERMSYFVVNTSNQEIETVASLPPRTNMVSSGMRTMPLPLRLRRTRSLFILLPTNPRVFVFSDAQPTGKPAQVQAPELRDPPISAKIGR